MSFPPPFFILFSAFGNATMESIERTRKAFPFCHQNTSLGSKNILTRYFTFKSFQRDICCSSSHCASCYAELFLIREEKRTLLITTHASSPPKTQLCRISKQTGVCCFPSDLPCKIMKEFGINISAPFPTCVSWSNPTQNPKRTHPTVCLMRLWTLNVKFNALRCSDRLLVSPDLTPQTECSYHLDSICSVTQRFPKGAPRCMGCYGTLAEALRGFVWSLISN